METKETKRHLLLDGGRKSDPSMSTRDYIEMWWNGLTSPSTYERNFFQVFSEHAEDLGRLSMQFFHLDHKMAREAKIKKIFGHCHAVGHSRLTWGKKTMARSTLWLGYVDVHENGLYLNTIKHTFVTWNMPSGERVIFDQILIKAVVERMNFTFSNYYGVPIPNKFPEHVENVLEGCGKARTAINYSVFMDHITFASDKSTAKLLAVMNRSQKNKRPG